MLKAQQTRILIKLTLHLVGLSVESLVYRPVNVGFLKRLMENLISSLWIRTSKRRTSSYLLSTLQTSYYCYSYLCDQEKD